MQLFCSTVLLRHSAPEKNCLLENLTIWQIRKIIFIFFSRNHIECLWFSQYLALDSTNVNWFTSYGKPRPVTNMPDFLWREDWHGQGWFPTDPQTDRQTDPCSVSCLSSLVLNTNPMHSMSWITNLAAPWMSQIIGWLRWQLFLFSSPEKIKLDL